EPRAWVLGAEEAQDAVGHALALDLLHRRLLVQLLLRRVDDEPELGQRRRRSLGPPEDAVVVVATRRLAVLGAGVGVGHPVDLVLAQGPDDLLVDEAGEALRLGRARALRLVV